MLIISGVLLEKDRVNMYLAVKLEDLGKMGIWLLDYIL